MACGSWEPLVPPPGLSTVQPVADLKAHPLPYGVPNTKGFAALLGPSADQWRALRERAPAAWRVADALRRENANYWVVAVVDMPGTQPDRLAMKPHVDTCLTPEGFDNRLTPIETDIVYLSVPVDLVGGELVLLSNEAARAWRSLPADPRLSDRDRLRALGARFLKPATGRGVRLFGPVCHAVMGYRASAGSRQALVVGQFRRELETNAMVFLA